MQWRARSTVAGYAVMIDRELAELATRLLSTVIGELVENHHAAMVSPPRERAAAQAHVAQLEQLGRDVATLAPP